MTAQGVAKGSQGHGDPIQIACDESGNDGENLLLGSSPVFVHASVSVTEEQAAEVMDEVRRRTGSQRAELKSKTLLQPGHRDTARWFLRHPLVSAQASVHLTHKKYFLVSKFFDATAEELMAAQGYDMYADGSALCAANILHFGAPGAYGTRWDELLRAVQHFLRAWNADLVIAAREELLAAFRAVLEIDSPLNLFVRTMHSGLPHLEHLSPLQLGERIDYQLRTLDPLIAGLGATVNHWATSSGRPVTIIHDEASELIEARVEAFKKYLAAPELVAPHRAGSGVQLAGVELVDSTLDQRVQVADLVAGLSRVVSERLLLGSEHMFFGEVEPLLSSMSIWPHPRLMDPKVARAVAQGE